MNLVVHKNSLIQGNSWNAKKTQENSTQEFFKKVQQQHKRTRTDEKAPSYSISTDWVTEHLISSLKPQILNKSESAIFKYFKDIFAILSTTINNPKYFLVQENKSIIVNVSRARINVTLILDHPPPIRLICTSHSH